MDKDYRKLIEQITIQNETVVSNAMKGVYKGQKAELKVLSDLLSKLYAEYGVDGLLKLSDTRIKVIGIKSLLTKMGKRLGEDEIKKVTSILGETYKNTYYKNAFVMDSGLKTDIKFDILKKEFIDAAVNAKYKGTFFSDRIWTEKANMIDKLQSSLVEAMQGKTYLDKIAQDIRKTFNVSAYESQRLVNTENARVQTQASYDIGISSGVDQVMWSSTLDGKTADEDASLDGKVWGINEDHPEPPLHPSCRCCLINVPYEGWTPTQRRDNETHELIPNQTYAEWKADKNIEE